MPFIILVSLLIFVGCGSSPRYGSTPTPSVQKDARGRSNRDVERGIASWYGKKYHGRTTASGEKYNMRAMTAAHKTLPFGTRVEVRDLQTGNRVTVTINDRGPFVEGRIIDLSSRAAKRLGIYDRGLAEVEVRVLR